ncbi:MAG: HAMP domain-containing protein [Methylacidiphilales bacterium]|nr:HAMP domain-containing protein [Candidatus Methylacidiphilales bacterium]
MRLNLKIGQKLGISAAIGMALVLTLVVLSRSALERVAEANAALERAAQVVRQLTEVKIDLRDTRGLFYQGNFVTSVEAVENAVAEGDKIAGPLVQRINQLASTAALAANRERLNRAKPLVESYLAGWREGVLARRQILQGQAKLADAAAGWRAEIAKLQAVAGRLGPDAAASIDHIDGHLAEVGAALWRFAATEDERLKDQARASVDAVIRGLREFQAKEPAPQVAASISTLIKFAEQHRDLSDTMSAASALRANTIKTIAPMRVEVTKLVDESLEAASQFEASLIAQVDQAIASAESNGLILGSLTVLVLIGSTVFGFFAIGRPISRVAGVLEQLAGGDKSVDIPFTSRGDEVGETARAANVFKDNLIRMDQMAAEQKAAEARAEAEKKQAMHQMASSFEQAVGGIIGAVSSAAGQLQGAAQTMSAAAEQTNRQSVAVASASEEASCNVQTVASAAEELAASVAEIGRRGQ